MTDRPPFHLAVPVADIEEARRFYGEVLGFPRGRSSEVWTDWDVHGHQVVTHQVPGHTPAAATAGHSSVDGHDVYAVRAQKPCEHRHSEVRRGRVTSRRID